MFILLYVYTDENKTYLTLSVNPSPPAAGVSLQAEGNSCHSTAHFNFLLVVKNTHYSNCVLLICEESSNKEFLVYVK